MKKENSNKKKVLSEDELLEVTGGNGDFITITCKKKKNQEACEEFGCEWNKETEKCIGDKKRTY